MKILLRIRIDGQRVLELDPDQIRALRIDDTDQADFILTALTDSCEFVLVNGSYKVCHDLLQKIHNTLDIHTIDI